MQLYVHMQKNIVLSIIYNYANTHKILLSTKSPLPPPQPPQGTQTLKNIDCNALRCLTLTTRDTVYSTALAKKTNKQKNFIR